MKAQIRKIIVQVDETHVEGGRRLERPTKRALAMAVIDNPYALQFSENLDQLIEMARKSRGGK